MSVTKHIRAALWFWFHPAVCTGVLMAAIGFAAGLADRQATMAQQRQTIADLEAKVAKLEADRLMPYAKENP